MEKLNLVISKEILDLILSESDSNIPLQPKFKELILNRCDIIILGWSLGELSDSTDPLYNRIRRDNGDSYIRGCVEQLDDDFYTDYTEAIFIVKYSLEECSNIREKYGVLCFNPILDEEYKFVKFLFARETLNLGKEPGVCNIQSLDDLKRYGHPFTNLYLFDNYFVKEFYNGKVCNNKALISLLQNLSNTNNPKTVHVHISKEVQEQNTANIIKGLKNFFTNIFGHDCKIGITKDQPNHDRNILTDYLWINSGDSFNKIKFDKYNGGALRTGNFTTLSFAGIGNFSSNFQNSQQNRVPGSDPSRDYYWSMESHRFIYKYFVSSTDNG